MDPIKAAIAAIESRQPGETFLYRQYAKEFGVVRSTLTRQHKRAIQGTQVTPNKGQNLSQQQELELLQYIKRLTERGLPPTRQMIQSFASTIARKQVSLSWVDCFVRRHAESLISRWTAGIDSNRHKADSLAKYKLYFELLQQKIEQYSIEAWHTYNIDEKGFLLGITSRTKRIFNRPLYQSKAVRQAIQDGSCEWISLIACICADGSALDPALIYQAASTNIQSSWIEDLNPQHHQVFVTVSESGWSNNQIGLAWLQQVFDRLTKSKARQSYRLLILNGHGSHVTMDFIDYCDRNRILLAIYPPHSTHTLQPLDVCAFKPLSTAYSNQLSAFLQNSQGLASIAKRDFFTLFWIAWIDTIRRPLILRAFEATGISPLDPTTILKRYDQAELPEQQSRESSTSVLSASDWRKIDRLLKAYVDVGASNGAKKLSRTVHSISVRAQLAEHKNQGLRRALATKKKRLKQGRPLPFDHPEQYHGGAIFWSPHSVQRACDRQHQKDAKEQQLQLQKSEQAEARKTSQHLKKRLLQEVRVARAAARDVRAKEKADQAAERALVQQARRAQKQRQDRIKLSQKGNKKAFRSSSRAIKHLQPQREAVDVDEAVSAPSTPSMRRGRIIKTPSRY
jgi:hypothetical protein